MNPIKKNHDAMLRTGAMALAAAGASTAAHAATVQITFNNSYISSTSGNHLVTDFGGDGVADLRGVNNSRRASVAGQANNQWLAFGSTSTTAYAGVRGVNSSASGRSVAQVIGVASFTLVDGKVRGGASTPGWLDVTATGRASGEKGRVEVWRFVFDDASGVAPTGVSHSSTAFPEYVAAVPEPSGLGLLALGAGGLLARRRRAMAV